VCDVCKKGFNYKPSLQAHLLTHTGQRPYVCDACNKAFYRKSNLRCHQKTHTG
jgi:uncharacterized Zn-finger protein